jgi:hypothetical protein
MLSVKMKDLFISKYLTHWTGKNKDEKSALDSLESIVSSKQLYLNYCPHFYLPIDTQANLRMVCFTDIPHYLSNEHCNRYGKFGIAFKKDNLKKYGANPVLYITANKKDDSITVYDFICNLVKKNNYNIPDNICKSLERFFGFVQDYSSENDIFYYEREWRILENNLKLEKSNKVDPGKAGINGEQCFLQFKEEDIEFLITPKEYAKVVTARFKYPVMIYEYLVYNKIS